ncbi:hypothetical protein [Streptomyces sp. UH6]|nr:hypothetical protein [Streptomyces sp. UH6]NYV72958.1 hypothetical protein [Streptomyces sp. UH6]
MTGAAWAVITGMTALGWALHHLALHHLTRDPLDDEHRHLVATHRQEQP